MINPHLPPGYRLALYPSRTATESSSHTSWWSSSRSVDASSRRYYSSTSKLNRKSTHEKFQDPWIRRESTNRTQHKSCSRQLRHEFSDYSTLSITFPPHFTSLVSYFLRNLWSPFSHPAKSSVSRHTLSIIYRASASRCDRSLQPVDKRNENKKHYWQRKTEAEKCYHPLPTRLSRSCFFVVFFSP